MKKLFSTAALLLPAVALFAQSGTFTIKGSINTTTPTKAFLLYVADGQRIIDSTDVVNGKFAFTGKITEPAMASLLISHTGETFGVLRMQHKIDVLGMYIEAGDITITGADSIKKATIAGSKLNAENTELTAKLKPLSEKLDALYAEERATKDATPQMSEAFDNRENALDAQKKMIYGQFIKTHPASYVSLNSVRAYCGDYMEYADLQTAFSMLSPELKATKQGKAYAELIPKLKLVAVGSQAPEFAQNDKDGKSIALSSFRGKYLLVDFWASWCGPCRRENPNVVKAYNQFKDKNFTILGVSLDQPTGREKWIAAIEKDGLVWTQVSDLKFWSNEAAALYGVRAIPQNFLIDPNGKIIGKNLFGSALVNKLAQLTSGGGSGEGGKTSTMNK